MAASSVPENAGFLCTLWNRLRWRGCGGNLKSPIQMRETARPPDNILGESLIDFLDPEGKGQYDGQRDDPPAGSGKQGAGEVRIMLYVKDRLLEWEEHANFWVRKHNEEMRESLAKSIPARKRSIVTSGKQHLSNLASDGERSVNEAKRQIEYAHRNEIAEGKRYGYDGEPDQGEDTFRHVVFVVMLLAFETAANGFFLGIRIDYGGLLGGLWLALLISILNGGIGFTMGFKCKGLMHEVKWIRKQFGWLAFTVGGLFLIYINVLVGHIRDRLEELNLDPTIASSGSATIDAVKRTFEFQSMLDAKSYFMAGIGALAAVLAVIAGWTAQSPHPRYLAPFERHRQRREEERIMKKDYEMKLSHVYNEYLEQLKSAETLINIENKPRRYLYLDYAKEASDMAKAAMHSWVEIAETLLSRYRNANERARNGDFAKLEWPPINWRTQNVLDICMPSEEAMSAENRDDDLTFEEAQNMLDEHYSDLKEKLSW